MTDATVISVVGSLLATVQVVSTAWLTRTVNKNACGSDKCLATLASKAGGKKE